MCTEVDLFIDWVCLPKFLGLCVYFVFMRFLFGPTVVPYSACNEGFIYWLLSYVYVFFPVISPLCCLFAIVSVIVFFSVLLAYFCVF